MDNKGPMALTGEDSILVCTCMQSDRWPLCDGSHHTMGGSGPEDIELDKDKVYMICQCYKTKNRPFCDNSHKK